MKTVITLVLLAGIYGCYFMLNSLIDRDVSVPGNKFDFSETDAETRKLRQFAQYQVISEKPLFDSDREPEKPVVEEKVVEKKKAVRQLKVQALGIAIIGENLLAVVKNLRTGKITKLKVGEAIEGWELASVSADQFVFEKDETRKSFSFKSK